MRLSSFFDIVADPPSAIERLAEKAAQICGKSLSPRGAHWRIEGSDSRP
jgi:hypothetical protein